MKINFFWMKQKRKQNKTKTHQPTKKKQETEFKIC